jgi:hypothetical protein
MGATHKRIPKHINSGAMRYGHGAIAIAGRTNKIITMDNPGLYLCAGTPVTRPVPIATNVIHTHQRVLW